MRNQKNKTKKRYKNKKHTNKKKSKTKHKALRVCPTIDNTKKKKQKQKTVAIYHFGYSLLFHFLSLQHHLVFFPFPNIFFFMKHCICNIFFFKVLCIYICVCVCFVFACNFTSNNYCHAVLTHPTQQQNKKQTLHPWINFKACVFVFALCVCVWLL